MSWSIEERIGECRPFPAQVIVYKGETDECMAYVSGDVADRLKAENTRLLSQLAEWRRVAESKQDIIDHMRDANAENAKLREFATDMYQCSDPCNDCPHYNSSSDGFYCDLGAGWKVRRMRELGIKTER